MPGKFKYDNPSIIRSLWMLPIGAFKAITNFDCYIVENTIDLGLTAALRMTWLGNYVPFAHQQVNYIFNGHPEYHPGIVGVFNGLLDGVANLGRHGVMVEEVVVPAPIMDAVIVGGELIGEAVIEAVEEIAGAVIDAGVHIAGAVIGAELGIAGAVVGEMIDAVENRLLGHHPAVEAVATAGIFATAYATIGQDMQMWESGLEQGLMLMGSAACMSSMIHHAHK